MRFSNSLKGKIPSRCLPLLACLAALLLSTALHGAQGAVCDGYAKSKQIGSLGGPNRFAGPVETGQDLAAAVEDLEQDIRYVLDRQGLGHLAQPLMNAIASGEGVTERDVVRGEKFQWMAWRRRGVPQVSDNLCVTTAKRYGAFEVNVPVVTSSVAEKPVCSLQARRDCHAGAISVDASGSSAEVGVVVRGTGPERTVIAPGAAQRTWEGADETPYSSTYTVTARGERPATQTVTTYTFLIPKVCLNVALISVETSQVEAAPERCEKTVSLEPCQATVPQCSIDVSPATARSRESVQIDLRGSWAGDSADGGVSVSLFDGRGRELSQPVVSPPFPTVVSFTRSGHYSVEATVANEVGETATCRASVDVRPGWTVRPYLARLDESLAVPSGVPSIPERREAYLLGDGEGIGVSAEYRFSERIGLEAGLLYARVDTSFVLDLFEEWGMDDDEPRLLMLDVGPNFHLTPRSRVDLYVGPFVGWADFGEATYRALGESVGRDLGSDFVLGVKAGLDIPFGARSAWALNLGVRYLSTSVDLAPGRSDDYEPTMFTLGLAYDF